MHRGLRGRYVLALAVALLGAAACGYAGWRFTTPLYRATASIYVDPVTRGSAGTPDPDLLELFEGFLASQVEVIQSGEVARRAVETDVWQGAGGATDAAGMRAFEGGRSAERVAGTHVVQLAFVDADPDVALAGVHALIEAYQAQFRELHGEEPTGPDTSEQEKQLVRRLRKGLAALEELTAEHGGVEGLEIRHRATVRLVMATEDALRTVRAAQARLEAGGTVAAEALVPSEIAVSSRSMAELLAHLAHLEAEERVVGKRLGMAALPVLELRQRSAVLEQGIDEIARDWNAKREALGAETTSAELEAREAGLVNRVERLQERSRELGRIRGEAKGVQAENEELDQQLVRIEGVEAELAAGGAGRGRIRIADPGLRPTSPYRDDRRLHAGIAGGAGGLLGFLIVLLAGLGDRRLKRAVAADDVLAHVRSLGLLPAFPTDPEDKEGGKVATHFTHQVRTLLEIAHAREDSVCLCVAGATTGSGKTTLAAALGLSFASTGSRTLLVDADPTGQGLTGAVMRMLACHVGRMGAVDADDPQSHLLEPLVRRSQGTPVASPAQLEALLTDGIERLGLERVGASGLVRDLFSLADLLDAGESRDRLALRLMRSLASAGELGGGTPAAWIPARTREVQHPGSLLDEDLLEEHLYRTGVEALRFLPLFGAGREGGSSVAMIAGVLSCLRTPFDVVLVDAGPVPGTDETSLIAVQADSVVLVVSPEDQGPQAERALAYLAEIGARVAGTVFNRAAHKDIVETGRTMYVSKADGPAS